MKVAILGCGGRMGKLLVQELYQQSPSYLKGCLEVAESPLVGQDAKVLIGCSNNTNVIITSDAEKIFNECDVFIDFTYASSAIKNVSLAKKFKKPIVIGTTGFNNEENSIIQEASGEIAIVRSSNMSNGVNLIFRLVEQAVKFLNGQDYDIEVIERHHKHKKDAPSGTAKSIINVVAKAKGIDNESHNNLTEIVNGVHALRGGQEVGEHSILFMGDGETIELKHTAYDRKVFVIGAIRAAKWIYNKPAGLYCFNHVVDED